MVVRVSRSFTIPSKKGAPATPPKQEAVEMSESPSSRQSDGIRLVSADKDSFEPSTGLSTLHAEDLLKVHGPNELPEKKDPYVSRNKPFRKFWPACLQRIDTN